VSARNSAITRGCPNSSPGDAAVVADAFDFEQSPVDLSFVDSKIMGVAESPFGPATGPFFEVLLQIEVLVVDMQARMHTVLNHPGSKRSRRFLRHRPVAIPRILCECRDFRWSV
jgi:hypothetical protein